MVQVMSIHPKKTMIRMSHQKLGATMEEIMMTTYRKGTLLQISMMRWKKRSSFPLK